MSFDGSSKLLLYYHLEVILRKILLFQLYLQSAQTAWTQGLLTQSDLIWFEQKNAISKNKTKRWHLAGHENCRFTITWSSYSVKSYYFNTICNMLRLLQLRIMIIVGATRQLLSIVIEKRGGKRGARYERTRITLRIEETSTLRVKKLLLYESLLCELKKLLLYESLCELKKLLLYESLRQRPVNCQPSFWAPNSQSKTVINTQAIKRHNRKMNFFQKDNF